MKGQKKILIIAGPNGAGKTTFATEFLPREGECPNFINADLIASGINPFNPEADLKSDGTTLRQCIKDSLMNGRFMTTPESGPFY